MGEQAVHRFEDRRALALALTITTAFLVIEAIGGIFTNSLALLADAGHMLSDAGALGLSLFAVWMSARPPTPQKTFGYYRAEILAAFVNAITLILVTLYVFWEAYRRISAVPEVQSAPMLAIASAGLLANVASAAILSRCSVRSLNIRAALLHVLGDALGSLAAITAGLIMLFTGRFLADPILSIFIGLLIATGAWRVLTEAVHILLEGAPGHLDVAAMETVMKQVPGVSDVHDLHVWAVTSDFIALSAHVVASNGQDPHSLLRDLQQALRNRFGVQHVTIQVENEALEENLLHR